MHKKRTTFPFSLVDLTHTIEENTPTWDGGCGFSHAVKIDYERNSSEVSFRVQTFNMHAGIGTHMDAPAHCFRDGETIEHIPLSRLLSRCIVIDVSAKAHESYQVSWEDVLLFEKEYGKIDVGTFVMIRTGWGDFWGEPEKYRNNHKFPTVSSDVARMFLERNISGMGIDTLSPDHAENGFPVHKILLGAGKYIVENAANLHSLSPIGDFILALPIKVKEATEAPIRLVGFKA